MFDPNGVPSSDGLINTRYSFVGTRNTVEGSASGIPITDDPEVPEYGTLTEGEAVWGTANIILDLSLDGTILLRRLQGELGTPPLTPCTIRLTSDFFKLWRSVEGPFGPDATVKERFGSAGSSITKQASTRQTILPVPDGAVNATIDRAAGVLTISMDTRGWAYGQTSDRLSDIAGGDMAVFKMQVFCSGACCNADGTFKNNTVCRCAFPL